MAIQAEPERRRHCRFQLLCLFGCVFFASFIFGLVASVLFSLVFDDDDDDDDRHYHHHMCHNNERYDLADVKSHPI